LFILEVLQDTAAEPLQSGINMWVPRHFWMHPLMSAQNKSYYTIKQAASEYQTDKSLLLSTPPLTAWMRNGEKHQNFNIQSDEARPSDRALQGQSTDECV